MGSNTGYGNNGSFQNNFNQDGFSQSPFSGAPQYFQPQPQQTQSNTMGLGGSSGESYMDFQPEVGPFNESAFAQNQFSSPAPQFSPPSYSVPHPTPPTPSYPQQLNSKAAELKARLLKGRGERANSQTPSAGIPGMVTQQPQYGAVNGSSFLRDASRTPVAGVGEHNEQKQDIQELISQYSSDSKPTQESSATIKQEKNSIESNAASYDRPSAISGPPAKSQPPSLGSPTKVLKPVSNGSAVKPLGSRYTSKRSLSEASEGEIVEDSSPPKSLPSTETKVPQPAAKPVKSEGQNLRRPRDEVSTKPLYTHGPRDESPPPRDTTSARPTLSRNRDDRREEAEPRPERTHQPDVNVRNERRQSYPRQVTTRDQYEDRRRTDTRSEQKRDDNRPTRETNPPAPPTPTLAQLLSHDEDLREWLEITGYHNEDYRKKTLSRRRQLAALEAQKAALLAEMEAEERGGLPVSALVPVSGVAMAPPPAPSKTTQLEAAPPKSEIAKPEVQRDRVVSNKRPYGEFQDGREDHDDHRRPRSSGFNSSRRSSTDRRLEREPAHSYGADSRGRGRGGSRERDSSPPFRAYENRGPPRSKGYESGSDDYFDMDDRDDRDHRDSRPFEVRGGYRGRAYDPNYRSRGRGGSRGRGDHHSNFEPRDSGQAPSFGTRIANGKPFKDHKGFNKGGKGDTRYFIVKSFNEDNVIKCIEDSIWTTQIQNGPIFKEAFESCRNVILVFSINKSRAFQGYARMESLPGSVDIPSWQKAINWESAGAFRVRWLVICSTRFQRIGHLKNALNENQAVLIGKDGQEIEGNCGAGLIELIDEEVDQALIQWRYSSERAPWDD